MPRASVRPGRDRPPTPYVWPASLTRPPGGVQVVYLDLNHWIALAKANTGHSDGRRHQPALEAIRGADARFVFPLSSVHYMEMAGIPDPRQRQDVATVMEEISGFACLMSMSVLMRLEIDAVVAAHAGRPRQIDPVPLLGRGVLQAFGRWGRLHSHSDDGDVTDAARASWPNGPDAFDAWRDGAERLLDRTVLRGPTDAEAPALRAAGWDPTVARRSRPNGPSRNALKVSGSPPSRAGGAAGCGMSSPRASWRSGPRPCLWGRSSATAWLWSRSSAARSATPAASPDSMPSADLHISLLTAAPSNAQTQWTPNDLFDIDALSVAVPYCDVVVTERHATHLLRAGGVANRLDTHVLATLDELVE